MSQKRIKSAPLYILETMWRFLVVLVVLFVIAINAGLEVYIRILLALMGFVWALDITTLIGLWRKDENLER